VYSTYLGGTGLDGGSGIAVDFSGRVYVVGSTTSTDFPLLNAFQSTLQGAGQPPNAFVTVFNPAGSGLIYSTYLGGGGDTATGIAIDPGGNAYITGFAGPNFPTKNPLQLSGTAFAAKLSADGQSLFYSTRLGAWLLPPTTSIAIDTLGNVYITGTALAPLGNLPILNAIQPTVGSMFIVEINPLGSALVFSTYLGGNTGINIASGIAVDGGGNIVVTGVTDAPDFPVLHAVQPNPQATPFTVFAARIVAGSGPPTITQNGIVPIYSSTPVIQPGSWVSIYGNNLASGTAMWNGEFPISLGGTSVTINNKPAYLSYVSPSQINLQAPDDATTGSVSVAVTTANGTATSTVILGQFGPSFSVLDGKHAAGIILRSDGSGAYGGGTYDIVGPTGTSLGYKTVAAKAGDTLELFGTGFGPTNPKVPAGAAYSGSAPTTNTVQLLINGTPVTTSFAGITSAGLYQLNVVAMPAGLGTGDVSLQATVGGNRTQSGVLLSLQ
jgi:uncharacterized protein (TIGR03437 family)